MKKPEEILKKHFSDKYLHKDFNVSHEICWADIIVVMEKYAEQKNELYTDEDVREFYYKEHGESHTLDAIPHDEAIGLMAESLGLTYKRAWEY